MTTPPDALRALPELPLLCRLGLHRWERTPRDHGYGKPYGRKCRKCETWKFHPWFDNQPTGVPDEQEEY